MAKFAVLAASILLLRALAMGQGETTSAIVGTVTDPTGAAISGASVAITNIDNGLKRSVKTDDAGRFSFPQLKPGTYAVSAEADHFEPQQNSSVSAELGQKQTVDFKLNIVSARTWRMLNHVRLPTACLGDDDAWRSADRARGWRRGRLGEVASADRVAGDSVGFGLDDPEAGCPITRAPRYRGQDRAHLRDLPATPDPRNHAGLRVAPRGLSSPGWTRTNNPSVNSSADRGNDTPRACFQAISG